MGIAFPLGQLRQLVAAMRPRQWAKNLLLYLAFFFTLGQHTSDGFVNELSLFGEATLGFLLFCLLSGLPTSSTTCWTWRRTGCTPRSNTAPWPRGA